jgi:DNA-binding SARP family transcriptional activator/tetratricopeptide (TPR) repeat protein
MRFRVLGPLEAQGGAGVVTLGGGLQRALLALLVMRAGEAVPRDRLIEDLWDGAPPPGASQSLDAYLSRLRRALREAGADGMLVRRAYGYVLEVAETDAAVFEAGVEAGRRAFAAGDPAQAAALLRGAVSLWRGNAYADVADHAWARPETQRLEELRLAAIEDRIDAELALAQHVALVPELELLAARHPTRERLVGQLMLALYRGGRQADALAAFRAARASLLDELGLEPGRALRELEAAVLRQDRALDVAPVDPPATSRASAEERKQVTVLFAGAADPLGLAERVDPEELRAITQRLLLIVREGVHRLEGTVDTVTGAGMVALFGAPVAYEDHARRACYAALHLQRELASYRDELRARGVELAMRMGLHSGEVVVGPLDEEAEPRYTAIGHAVGVAQGTASLAASGAVYVSDATAALARGWFDLRDLGERRLAGTDRALRIYELAGLGAARGALDVSRARGLSGFVGRDAELRALEHALEQGLAGKGRLVGIVGDAGVGKSRLCHEFVERQRDRGIPVYHVAGQAHTKAVALLPVLGLLRAFFAIDERDGAVQARARIAARLRYLDAGLEDELPLIFDFLAVPDPRRPAERMDADARQRRLLSFTKRLTRAQGRRRPAIMVFEDLHWLDQASEAFLAGHIDAAPGTPGLTILNFRPEYQAPWMSRSYYQQIALEPLAQDAVDGLLAELLGTDPSLAELGALVRERAQGNPFFIEELVRALADAGSLEGPRGRYRLARPVPDAAVPATVQAVLAARIDRLEAREKGVLQTAAVIGREVPRSVLERVATLDAAALEDALAALVASEFVHEHGIEPEPAFAFNHPLTREVAYRSLLGERRTAVHAAVARAIAGQDPERLGERAALIAQHWEAAREDLEAARWHARAATWAAASDPRQALQHWNAVRRLADPLPATADSLALRVQARLWLLHSGWRLGLAAEELEALFLDTERLTAERGDLAAQALVLSAYSSATGIAEGSWVAAGKLFRRSLELAERVGDPGLKLAVSLGGYSYYATGELGEGVRTFQRLIDHAHGDATAGAGVVLQCPYAYCHFVVGICLTVMGQLAEARRQLALCESIADAHRDPEVAGWAHMWSVPLAYFQGAPHDAVAHAHEALAIAERLGGPFQLTIAWLELGAARVQQADWERAIQALERSATLAATHRLGELGGWRLALLAEAHAGLGDTARARALAHDGVRTAVERGQVMEEALACLSLARVLLAGDGAGAATAVEAALARALELARTTGALAFEPLAREELAELSRRAGDAPAHERELRTAQRLFAAMGATGHSERVAAQLERLSG